MTDTNRIERIAQAAAHLKTKFVIAYYLLTIVTSIVVFFVNGRLAFAADLLAVGFYLAVTILLHDLSQPKPRSLRLFAMLVDILGFTFQRSKVLPRGRTLNTIAPHGA
jgi:hypothetical protein